MSVENNKSSAQPTQPNTSNTLKSLDCIDRQAAIDALMSLIVYKYKREIVQAADKHENSWIGGVAECIDEIEDLPSAQPDGWLEQNKDKILQAGMEDREIDFRIGGRLFAIREKAQ